MPKETLLSHEPSTVEKRRVIHCSHCSAFQSECSNFVAHQAGFCPIDGQMAESFGRMYKHPKVLQSLRMIDKNGDEPKKPSTIPEFNDKESSEIGVETEATLDRVAMFLRDQQGGGQPPQALSVVEGEFNADTVKFENHQATLERAFDFEQTPNVHAFLVELKKMGSTGQVVLVDSTTNYPMGKRIEKFDKFQGYEMAISRPIAEIHTALNSAWNDIYPLLDKYPGRMIALVLTQKLAGSLGPRRLIAQTENRLLSAIEANDHKKSGVYNFVDHFIKLLAKEKGKTQG